jgi:hypothetical protein
VEQQYSGTLRQAEANQVLARANQLRDSGHEPEAMAFFNSSLLRRVLI